MDNVNWLIAIHTQQLVQERLDEAARQRQLAALRAGGDLRRSIASVLVRLSVWIHPAAVEGAQARSLRRAEARR